MCMYACINTWLMVKVNFGFRVVFTTRVMETELVTLLIYFSTGWSTKVYIYAGIVALYVHIYNGASLVIFA